MSSIGILGAGTWGVALARSLALNGHDVTVWSALPEEIDQLRETRVQRNLPGVALPESIVFEKNLETACADRDVIVFAVPSVFVRQTARQARRWIPDGQIVVDVAKGIEPETYLTLTSVIDSELEGDGAHGRVRLVALSGPTHAEEVARDMPTAIVAASPDTKAAERVQQIFSSDRLRVYTNDDMRGVELCGALKNVIALCAGIATGLGYGDNARAALITRGMAEIARLGSAMGCRAETFAGLTGIGDLVVTATSPHSRNNRAGIMIGQGVPPMEAVKRVGMVVEGINALPAATGLAKLYKVEMPLVDAVDAVVNGGADPRAAAQALMGRELKNETGLQSFGDGYRGDRNGDGKGNGMKRVITYGTFDLLHYGHINLLKRAKALGDYLVVALSTDEFNWNEKQKKCYFTYAQRKALLESIRYVDLVIPEENWEQKRSDVHEYHIDTFVIGDDWTGKFDFLKDEGVEVVYLPRTPEISTTQIKQDLNRR